MSSLELILLASIAGAAYTWIGAKLFNGALRHASQPVRHPGVARIVVILCWPVFLLLATLVTIVQRLQGR